MRTILGVVAAFSILVLTPGCVRQTINQKESEMAEIEKSEPKVNVRFIFSICNDVEEMRRFYSDLLGMKEQAFYKAEDGKFGYLSYMCAGGLEVDFFYTGKEVPALTEWAWQPGYEGGNFMVTSWAIEIPEEDFPATVKRLKDAGVKSFSGNPEWRQDSYWGFSVADPQGNTIEVYAMPKEKPGATTWPGN